VYYSDEHSWREFVLRWVLAALDVVRPFLFPKRAGPIHAGAHQLAGKLIVTTLNLVVLHYMFWFCTHRLASHHGTKVEADSWSIKPHAVPFSYSLWFLTWWSDFVEVQVRIGWNEVRRFSIGATTDRLFLVTMSHFCFIAGSYIQCPRACFGLALIVWSVEPRSPIEIHEGPTHILNIMWLLRVTMCQSVNTNRHQSDFHSQSTSFFSLVFFLLN
jgi:hypothetical protein